MFGSFLGGDGAAFYLMPGVIDIGEPPQKFSYNHTGAIVPTQGGYCNRSKQKNTRGCKESLQLKKK